MSNIALFISGMVVFVLMMTGLVLTMVGFRAVSDRPDRVRGLPDAQGRMPRDPGEAGSR